MEEKLKLYTTKIESNVMGNWGDFETEDGRTFATLTFDGENPKTEFVYGQYVRGFLRAVRVGFIPHLLEFDDDTPVLKGKELLEISPVGVPANANALALSLKDGSLNRKDAQWMIRSMTEATASLEEQLNKNAPAEGEETKVEEVKEQLKPISELMVSLSETVTALNTSVETINTDLGEVKSAVADLKPSFRFRQVTVDLRTF